MNNHYSFNMFWSFHFKKDQIEEGIKFFKEKYLDYAWEYGCMGFELFENHSDGHFIMGISYWNSKSDMDKFHKYWTGHEKELSRYLSKPMKIEYFSFKEFLDKKHRRKTA